MAIVIFNPVEWLDAHPQFQGKFTDAQLNHFFELACLLLDNTDASPVPYDPARGVNTRKILFRMLVCHLATLAMRPAEQAGALTSATEGSVSASFQLPQTPGGEWYQQTACGQAYWQAIRKYLVGGRYYDVRHFHPWG